ncbi:MAG: alpha/beta fold hydrolase [Candidatus Sericytochromatia bacterium]|nr:alpha/beta fold hydrolase [Candidatus Sericytochromatia bacterium]
MARPMLPLSTDEGFGPVLKALKGFRSAFPQQPARVGQTPKQVVWRRNKAKLLRYEGQGERRHATPVLFVYALINKPYILDLQPGSSLIEYLVAQGHDVYLLDWGVPGEEDGGMTLADIVTGMMPSAVRAALRCSGTERLTMFGYCQGGTLAAMYAALDEGRTLANLVLLTTPIDFAEAGLYSNWLNPDHADIDRLADSMKLIPAELMDFGAKLLKPVQNWVTPYVRLFENLDDEDFVESWRAMNGWVADGIPMPAEVYRQWAKDFYQGNKLVKGEVMLGARRVDLSRITCPLLVVHATLDHIVPTCQSTVVADLVSSTDVTVLPVKAGHVGVVVGKGPRRNFFPQLDAWLQVRS